MKIRCAAQYSGSLGNRTWGINRGQQYVRRRSVPVNRCTERQGRVRSILGKWASTWAGNLSQEHRDAWRTYAQNHFHRDVFGQKHLLPPICWPIMLNSRLLDAGQTQQAMPPPFEALPAFWGPAVHYLTDERVGVKWTYPSMVNRSIQLFQSLPASPGKRPSFQHMRLVAYSPVGQTSIWFVNLRFPVHPPKIAIFRVALMDRYGQISMPSFVQGTPL